MQVVGYGKKSDTIFGENKVPGSRYLAAIVQRGSVEKGKRKTLARGSGRFSLWGGPVSDLRKG